MARPTVAAFCVGLLVASSAACQLVGGIERKEGVVPDAGASSAGNAEEKVVITSLRMSAEELFVGRPAKLSWSSEHADTCAFDKEIGTVPTAGSKDVVLLGPATSVTLTCEGPGGRASERVSLRVVRVRSLVSGARHSCALLDNGRMKCWGDNRYGQLGLGDRANRGAKPDDMGDHLPAVDVGPGRTVQAIFAGYNRTCALLDNHALVCWGQNTSGQLGLEDVIDRGGSASDMGAGLDRVDLGAGQVATTVALGLSAGCARLDRGSVKCWGVNANGDLGIGTDEFHGDQPHTMGANLPPVLLGGATAASVSAGSHACALLDGGHLKCWGQNFYGQLGLGDTRVRGRRPDEMGDALAPVDLGTGRTAVSVVAAVVHTCALLDDGTLKCWGANDSGRLGLGDTVRRGSAPGQMGDALPALDFGAGRKVRAVAALLSHGCVVLDDGAVKCWGAGADGRLGLGDLVDRGASPGTMGDRLPAVDLGRGRTAVLVTAAELGSCALLDTGQVKCWGNNELGTLGLGDVASRGKAPNEMGDRLPAVDLGL